MQKQTLYDNKDTFLDVFRFPTPHEAKPITQQLETIVERINDKDLDTNVKLLEWYEKKFQTKVDKQISSAITLHQVELETKIEGAKKYYIIFSLFTPCCVIQLYSHKNNNAILTLYKEI